MSALLICQDLLYQEREVRKSKDPEIISEGDKVYPFAISRAFRLCLQVFFSMHSGNKFNPIKYVFIIHNAYIFRVLLCINGVFSSGILKIPGSFTMKLYMLAGGMVR